MTTNSSPDHVPSALNELCKFYDVPVQPVVVTIMVLITQRPTTKHTSGVYLKKGSVVGRSCLLKILTKVARFCIAAAG